jgi:RNA polymerase sigma-70 factor (ECF subfamily)
LSDEHRQAIELIVVGGLPYEAAAELCGCALGTIKSRMNRARASLARILEGDDLKADVGSGELALATLTAAADMACHGAPSRRRHAGAAAPMGIAA